MINVKNISKISIFALCLQAVLFWNCTEIPDKDEWMKDTVPSNVKVTATSSSSITVSWSSVPNARGYNISRSENSSGNFSYVGSTGSTSYTNTGLPPNTTYYYRVVAYNNAGRSSSQSSTVSATTAATVPSAPTDVTAKATSSNEITISWYTVTGATEYKIYRSATSYGDYDSIGVSTSTSYIDTGIGGGTTYYYKVAAHNSAGTGTKSTNTVFATTMFDTPSDVTATAASSSSINVSWNSVTGADGYYIYRSTSSSGTYNQIGFSTSTSYTNNGLSPSLTYYYKVEAYKGTLKSPQSVSVSATTHSTGSGTINAKDTAMVFVQGGTFTMGCTSEQESNCDSSEKPIFSVTLSNYSIGKYEVTQRLWEAVMNNNPSNFKGDGSRPVETVSWNDVDTFIVKLNALTGKKYRLPTEAEWEYAARGGNKASGHKYAGSDTIGTVAWYYGNNGSSGSINYGTKPVGTKEPNELGIYDMSGNVWEWVSDWYEEYTSWAKTNPRGPESGSYRVFRGGGWYNDASHCRVSDRYDYYPGNRNSDIGFRLVLPSP